MIRKVISYFTNQAKLWYDKIENKGVRNMTKKKKGIFEAKDLACYIKDKYVKFTKNTKEITPIKMQKALYFCFAYWAGFVNKGKIDGVVDNAMDNILFDDKFEAWAYGPVVPSVYFNEKTAQFFRTKKQEEEAIARVEAILDSNDFLKETLNSIIDDVFGISDFKLVSLSHMDLAWQNHFNETASKHNEEIPQKEIIDEYTTKKFD